MTYQQSTKRISFRLDTQLYTTLTERSRQMGIPKSKLINCWMKEFDSRTDLPKPIKDDRDRLYSFYTDTDSFNKITDAANRLSTTPSNLLRQLLVTNLTSINPTNSKQDNNLYLTDVENLWLSGKLSEIRYLVDDKVEQLSLPALVIYAQTCMEMADLHQANSVINYIESIMRDKQDLHTTVTISLLRSRLNIFLEETKNALSQLETARSLAQLLNNPEINGQIEFQLAVIADLNSKPEIGIQHYRQALNLLSKHRNIVTIIEIYIRLSKAYTSLLQFDTCNFYIAQAEELLAQYPNLSLQSFANYEKSFANLIQGNHQASLGHSNQCIITSRECGNNFKLANSYELYSIASLLKDNYSLMRDSAHRAHSVRQLSRLEQRLSVYRILYPLIKCQSDYARGVAEMEVINKHSQAINIRADLYGYYHFASQYVYARNSADQQIGLLNLRKLQANARYPLTRLGAGKTIETKQFFAVR